MEVKACMGTLQQINLHLPRSVLDASLPQLEELCEARQGGDIFLMRKLMRRYLFPQLQSKVYLEVFDLFLNAQ